MATGKRQLPEVYIDLENAQPKSDNEQHIVDKFTQNVLTPAVDVLREFGEYTDGQVVAGQAISNGTDEAHAAAWAVIYPNVQLQMQVYEFGQTLASEFAELVDKMVGEIESNSLGAFEQVPAMTRCLVRGFDTILKFEEVKMQKLKLTNDLSYFRRHSDERNKDGTLDTIIDLSNRTTTFWAVPTPFLSGAIAALSSGSKLQNVLTLMGSCCTVATSMLANHKDDNPDLRLLCLRCIVASTVVYDHLSQTGAFLKKMPFQVRAAMEVVINYQPRQAWLINTIKYSSKHLKDEASDPKIKALFA